MAVVEDVVGFMEHFTVMIEGYVMHFVGGKIELVESAVFYVVALFFEGLDVLAKLQDLGNINGGELLLQFRQGLVDEVKHVEVGFCPRYFLARGREGGSVRAIRESSLLK